MMDEIKELKAQAYDLLAALEQGQAKLREINTKILELHKKSLEVKNDAAPVEAI